MLQNVQIILQNVHSFVTECTSKCYRMYNETLQNVHLIITKCTPLLQNVQVIIFKFLLLLLQNVQEMRLTDFIKLKRIEILRGCCEYLQECPKLLIIHRFSITL